MVTKPEKIQLTEELRIRLKQYAYLEKEYAKKIGAFQARIDKCHRKCKASKELANYKIKEALLRESLDELKVQIKKGRKLLLGAEEELSLITSDS